MDMKKTLYTNKTLFKAIVDILIKKGLLPDHLDYYLAESKEVNLKNYEWDCTGDLSFGGSEGQYLDLYATGDIGDNMKKVNLGTFKTLDESRESFYKMAKLQADFIWETREFIREHIDDFTWTGYDVKLFKGEKKISHVEVHNKDRVEAFLKRKCNVDYDYAIIIENATGKEKRIKKEDVALD